MFRMLMGGSDMTPAQFKISSKQELKDFWKDDPSLDIVLAGIYDRRRENSNYVRLLEHFGIRQLSNDQILNELNNFQSRSCIKNRLEVFSDEKSDQRPYHDVAIWDINSEVKLELFELSKIL